jgi:hypothetical protein
MFFCVVRSTVRNSLLLRHPLQRTPLCSVQPVTAYSKHVEENAPETKPPQRSRLSLRGQTLPPYPQIEVLKSLDVKQFLPSNFKIVKHGQYEFKECLEGYVHVYATAHSTHGLAGYAVYYGEDHPLNSMGPVEGRLGIRHARLYGFLQVLRTLPKDLFKKVCIGLDDLKLTTFLSSNLHSMSENAFHSTYTGRLNKDLETNMEINTLLRTRTDLTFRLQYVPSNCCIPLIKHARKMAMRAARAANDAERRKFENQKYRQDNGK